jgi:hypothetical protein
MKIILPIKNVRDGLHLIAQKSSMTLKHIINPVYVNLHTGIWIFLIVSSISLAIDKLKTYLGEITSVSILSSFPARRT